MRRLLAIAVCGCLLSPAFSAAQSPVPRETLRQFDERARDLGQNAATIGAVAGAVAGAAAGAFLAGGLGAVYGLAFGAVAGSALGYVAGCMVGRSKNSPKSGRELLPQMKIPPPANASK